MTEFGKRSGVLAICATALLCCCVVLPTASAQFALWTNKAEYQFGEEITINWDNATVGLQTLYGIFIAGQCSTTPNTCTVNSSYVYSHTTASTAKVGAVTFYRGDQTAFWGQAEVIAWQAGGNTILGALNVTIVGTHVCTPSVI